MLEQGSHTVGITRRKLDLRLEITTGKIERRARLIEAFFVESVHSIIIAEPAGAVRPVSATVKLLYGLRATLPSRFSV